jgi:PAS domain S-box-containing protein
VASGWQRVDASNDKVQARFKDLLESVPDGIVVVNRDGTIVLCNRQAERLFGYDAGELMQRSIELLLPAAGRAAHVRHRSGFFAHPAPRAMGREIDLFGLRKDGTEFPIEIMLSPLENADGILVTTAIRDITARAGVSYPVFFRRYETREQLLEDIAAEEVRRLLMLTLPIFNANMQEQSLRTLCRYVDEHRRLWTQLLTGGAGGIMREEFKRIAVEVGGSQPRSNPWLPHDLAASFVVGGLFEILAWWMGQPSDYPIENVVKIIDALIVRSTGRPMGIELD